VSRVDSGDSLCGSTVAWVRLVDGISRGELMAMEVVVVLNSDRNSNETSAPLAISRVELGNGLVRASMARVGLVDGISRGELMTMDVVTVLSSQSNSMTNGNTIANAHTIATIATIAKTRLSIGRGCH